MLRYRATHGRFRRVEELLQVGGIGEKKLARLRPLVRP
ncbi:helix-hairpin-helix domain-containing protein [Acinetobacter baumannii]